MSVKEKFTLNVVKLRNVELPTKSYKAAGWDFYIPRGLHITDFTKNIEIYRNDYIKTADSNGMSTTVFTLTDGAVFIDVQIGIRDDKTGFTYQLGDASADYPFTDLPGMIEWINADDTRVVAFTILSGGKVLIPSGIQVNLPDNVYLNADNKSGIASKRGLIVGPCVVDSDYRGEIHIGLINPTRDDAKIICGEKIVQFLPCFSPDMNELKEFETADEMYAGTTSERGADGFGSTDKKVDPPAGNITAEAVAKKAKGRPPKDSKAPTA